ncbi:hypothetical protein F4803DRAFT_527787 [Xylaria telfairii]|nr:hypothetical protein F4803DRAFT_527787 [Xylaria telfairii]
MPSTQTKSSMYSRHELGGFRYVIGILWDVNKKACAGAVRIIYRDIRERGSADEAASHRLHKASEEFRGCWPSPGIETARSRVYKKGESRLEGGL